MVFYCLRRMLTVSHKLQMNLSFLWEVLAGDPASISHRTPADGRLLNDLVSADYPQVFFSMALAQMIQFHAHRRATAMTEKRCKDSLMTTRRNTCTDCRLSLYLAMTSSGGGNVYTVDFFDAPSARCNLALRVGSVCACVCAVCATHICATFASVHQLVKRGDSQDALDKGYRLSAVPCRQLSHQRVCVWVLLLWWYASVFHRGNHIARRQVHKNTPTTRRCPINLSSISSNSPCQPCRFPLHHCPIS